MTDTRITRRRFIVVGGAASVLVATPSALRIIEAGAATSSPASVGFLDTTAPLSTGMRVRPIGKVRGDASLVNRALQITIPDVYPSGDASFPKATLDTVFPQSGATFLAFTHAGGPTHGRSVFTMTPTSEGLQFILGTDAGARTAVLGTGAANGLRIGTYLFGLGARTWSSGGTLAASTAQRSVVMVIRAA